MLTLVSSARSDDPPARGKMADMGMPGPEHKALMKLAGDYTVKNTMRMGDAPAMESMGTAKLAAHLDGRFLGEHGDGEMMGQKFTTFKVYGYNAGAKKYEGMWAYTGNTSMMNLSGTSDDGGKTIKFTGTFEQSPGQKVNFQITMKRIDDDHFTVEMASKNPDGTPGPTMMSSYSRKK
jgi:hypothetical protein